MVEKRGVALAISMLGIACASDPKPAPHEDPTPLVIPPMPTASASQAPVAAPDPSEDSLRGGPSIAARDPRMASRRPRSRAHTLTEVQGLERLLSTVQKTAPDRPQLLRRIAEDYIELARTSDGSARSDARRKAIDAYETIVNDHASYGQLDEVRYFLGLEHELGGNPTKARAAYYDLIRSHPNSKYIPLAYFGFGELFFEEAKNDASKNELAVQAYNEVLKYPANAVLPDALQRLAQTHERQGDPVKAKAMLDKLLRDHPESEAAQRAKR
jgi:TolA-binding protein